MKRLISVISCHSYQYPKHDEGAAHHSGLNPCRSEAIRNTWYRTWQDQYTSKIDFKFFLGRNRRSPRENEIFLECEDDYYTLPRKVQKMFQWALEQDYTDVIKTDDDIFCWVDRLLSNFSPAKYKGFVLESADGKYTSGTAYWLDREAMTIVAEAKWNPKDWAEDKWVGKTLASEGIYPEHDERYQCCHCKDCEIKFPKDSRITSHLIDPREMYELMENK